MPRRPCSGRRSMPAYTLFMKINMTEWMRSLIAGGRVAAVPIMTHPGIELIGRRVVDAVSDGRVHADAVKALAAKYPTAAATVIMDLTVEAEAFGADIVKEPDEVPAVRGHLLDGVADIKKLEVPSLRAGRVPEYIKASMLASVEPVSAAAFMIVWLGVPFHYMDLLGFACILATVFLLTRRDNDSL